MKPLFFASCWCICMAAFAQEATIRFQNRDYLFDGQKAYHLTAEGQTAEVLPQRIVVKPMDVKRFSSAFLESHGLPGFKVQSHVFPGGYVMVDLDPGIYRGDVRKAFSAAARLAKRGWVEYIEFDGKTHFEPEAVSTTALTTPYHDCYPNDPLKSWHLDRINMYKAWCYARPASWVTVAVIDSSFLLDHVDFEGLQFVKPWDFVDGDSDVRAEPSTDLNQSDFHGTRVLGLIAAKADNGIGVAGIAGQWHDTRFDPPKVMPIRVRESHLQMVEGLEYARLHGAKVINLSIATFDSSPLRAVVAAIESSGITLVAASGNSENAPIGYPARLSSVIAVGSVQEGDVFGFDSYYAPEKVLDVVAPIKVATTSVDLLNGQFVAAYAKQWKGTSAATPQVTGVVALMLATNPGLTTGQIRAIIHQTADYIGPKFGNGVLDALQCIQLASQL